MSEMSHTPYHHLKAVLIDLSGTLHIDKLPIPGAQTALKRLRQSGLLVKFVTNTTKEDLSSLHQRLVLMNFAVQKKEIFTSLSAARRLIEKRGIRPHLMLSGSAMKDFIGIETNDPNCVLMGLSPQHFEYEPMNKALNLLLNKCELIAINKARYFKRPDDLSLGTGAFVAALEYSSGATATIVGKPERSFFHSAIEEFECDPCDCVMIGDDVRDDIGGAINAGMKGILVQTGKYRDGDEDAIRLSSEFVAKDFPHAVDMILSNR